MAELSQEEMIRVLEENITKIDKKEFKVYFFVPDTKGNPSGALQYIYQTALTLKKLGYDVEMLHQEKDFEGVGSWLGEAFAGLPHKNIETENVEIGPSDFLFIPEVFTGVMAQTKNLPCKRVIILQNFNFFVESMNISSTLEDLKIRDIITTSKELERKILTYFPHLHSGVVSPAIQKVFRKNNDPKDLIINIVSRNQSDVHKIIKPFYWAYPEYKWVSFRDLRGFSQDKFAEFLRKGAFTIWVDTYTDFGYSAIEALNSGSIVIAKAPDHKIEWTEDSNENLIDAVIWFNDYEDLPRIIASVVRSWTIDAIPEDFLSNASKLENKYTIENQEEDIKKEYIEGIFEKRKAEYTDILKQIKK